MRSKPYDPLLILPLLLYSVLLVCGVQTYDVCKDPLPLIANKNISQFNIAYNPIEKEYLIVYIQEDVVNGKTVWSVLGNRLTEDGVLNPDAVEISSYEIDPYEKRSPAVACNELENTYMVVFEYDYYGNGSEIDVAFNLVMGNGELKGDSHFYLTGYNGRDDQPQVVWNRKQNSFIVVHEIEYYNSISNQRNTEIATITVSKDLTIGGYVVGTKLNERRPYICYNPPTGNFYLAFESDVGGSSNIFGIFVSDDGAPQIQQSPFPLAITVHNGTHLRDHSPQLQYAEKSSQLFLTYEVDTSQNGDETEETFVMVTNINSITGMLKPSFRLLQGSNKRNRNPHLAYSNLSKEFAVVWESDDPTSNEGKVNISGAFVYEDLANGSNAQYFKLPTHGSREQDPIVEYSPIANEFVVLWRDHILDQVEINSIANREVVESTATSTLQYEITTEQIISPQLHVRSIPAAVERKKVTHWKEHTSSMKHAKRSEDYSGYHMFISVLCSELNPPQPPPPPPPPSGDVNSKDFGTSQTDDESKPSEGLSGGAIAGIVMSTVAVGAGAVAGVAFFRIKRKKGKVTTSKLREIDAELQMKESEAEQTSPED